MSVQLRGNHWHYRFMISGTTYSGSCAGCTNFSQAKKFETDRRHAIEREVDAVKQNKTVAALVENYRKELSGGSDVTIASALGLASSKPSRRAPGAAYAHLRESYWNAFVSFLASNYQDVTLLSDIRRSHCEAFVSDLVERRSPKTIREYVMACKWVMSRLEEDAGLVRNPFDGVVIPAPDPTPRDVFSFDELALIAEALPRDTFCLPLFIIAANSGLTEGDICTLRWDEVDFTGMMIRRTRRKTGVSITLPMLPELAAYLSSLPRASEYVLPEHADRYLTKRTSVPYRVKSFLESIGIKTTVEKNGRKISVKDLHSMRHLFAYRAKKAGIPESTIQKMVGHAVLEMTKHYADHDTDDDLREQIKKLPALFVGDGESESDESADRQKLAGLLPGLPIEVIRRWLDELAQPRQLPR